MWQRFKAQFLLYGAFVTAAGLIRCLVGQVNGLMGFLAWEAVYLPLVAALALVLAYRVRD